MKHLKANSSILDKFEIIADAYIWRFDKFTLNLWKDGDFSLHKNLECCICSFKGGIPDSFYFYKIKQLLKNAIAANKH
jgi:hypothetical protein